MPRTLTFHWFFECSSPHVIYWKIRLVVFSMARNTEARDNFRVFCKYRWSQLLLPVVSIIFKCPWLKKTSRYSRKPYEGKRIYGSQIIICQMRAYSIVPTSSGQTSLARAAQFGTSRISDQLIGLGSAHFLWSGWVIRYSPSRRQSEHKLLSSLPVCRAYRREPLGSRRTSPLTTKTEKFSSRVKSLAHPSKWTNARNICFLVEMISVECSVYPKFIALTKKAIGHFLSTGIPPAERRWS